MFGEQFYPTPRDVIEKMMAPYLNEYGNLKDTYNRILEPSAGKGDILDFLKEKKGYKRFDVFCFEIDLDLQQILKSKNARILGDDFLEYSDDLSFDLIVMNPPFNKGVDHLLKAWEIAQNTEIVCLLNAESIRNPFTGARKLLAKIIEDNAGEVQFFGSCFDDAERKTGVEVAMVRLTKKTSIFDFDIDMEKDFEKFKEDDFEEKGLMSHNKIGSIVSQYKESKDIIKRILKDMTKLGKIMNQISGKSDYGLREILGGYGGASEKYDIFLRDMKKGIWNELIDISNIEKYMTTKLRNSFQEFILEQSDIDISEKNIAKFIEFVILNRGSILENSIVEVFDELTKYDIENRYFPEGWKTNDNWKVNKKFIISWFGLSYDNKYKWTDQRNAWSFHSSEKLNNIDKVMCYITGREYTKITTVSDAIDRAIRGYRTTEWVESSFFEVRFYKKGSAHLKFKDDFVWQEFNMRACASKNWLPKSEKESWEQSKKESIEQLYLTNC